jgi:hypothetical protein
VVELYCLSPPYVTSAAFNWRSFMINKLGCTLAFLDWIVRMLILDLTLYCPG